MSRNKRNRRNRRHPRLGVCYPGYRYCGPGCSGPGKPVNEVDRCCMYHDECYRLYGRTRFCDEMFEACLNQYKHLNNKMGKDARVFSRAIKLKNFFF